MKTVADAIRGAYGVLDKPPQSHFPYPLAIQLAGEAVSARNLDANLAGSFLNLAKKEVRQSGATEKRLSFQVSTLGLVTSRASDSDSEEAEDVVSYVEIAQARAEGRPAVALYGGDTLLFSREDSDRVWTIWYTPAPTSPSALTDRITLPDEFFTLIQYDLAFDGIQFCGRDAEWVKLKTAFIGGKRAEWERRWQSAIRRPVKRGAQKKRPFRLGADAGYPSIGWDGLPRA
jgi:hypothetical protein